VTVRPAVIRRVTPFAAYHGVGLVVDGELVEGESVGGFRPQRAGLMTAVCFWPASAALASPVP
jgi:hypothetical protein